MTLDEGMNNTCDIIICTYTVFVTVCVKYKKVIVKRKNTTEGGEGNYIDIKYRSF